jgi:hypothetical protein
MRCDLSAQADSQRQAPLRGGFNRSDRYLNGIASKTSSGLAPRSRI